MRVVYSMTMEVIRKDVIVVGLGAFGSAAAWRLSARGLDVAGVERYGIGHPQGSTHGTTRLFRVACMEHTGLAAVALKSLELWTALGEQVGEQLVLQTGGLSVGAPDSRPVAGTLGTAKAAGLPVSEFGHGELVARFPQFAGLAPDDVGVWDPGAGICFPERTVRAQTDAARQLGADIYPHTMVTGIELSADEVTVRTATVEFRAPQVIVAAGAWLQKFVPELSLGPRRTPMYWFRPRDPESRDFTLDRFPAFVWRRPNGQGLWGHGSHDGFGIKVGPGEPPLPPGDRGINPDKLDRYIHLDTDIEPLAAIITEAFPGLDPVPEKAIPCMITDSPDGQFVVGTLPGQPNIVVAGGDSGHGFKHCAGIGELLAQTVTGERPYCETGFLDLARFW